MKGVNTKHLVGLSMHFFFNDELISTITVFSTKVVWHLIKEMLIGEPL